MANYRQQDIDELISCLKLVLESPKPVLKLMNGHWRNDARLMADKIKGEFLMFMRINEDFPENFSVGLKYVPNDERGEIDLLRCNGQHGVFNGSGFKPNQAHWEYHIHRADEAAIVAGLRPEKYAVKTAEYASFEEAVQYFVMAVNLSKTDAQKYFPKRSQTDFAFS